jgi:hypothetical protein
MDAYTIGWYGWIAWFAVEEGLALHAGHGTATANMLRWFGVRSKTGAPIPNPNGWQRARRALMLLGLAFLAAHFTSGGTFV